MHSSLSVPCVTSHYIGELAVHSNLSVAVPEEAGCSFIWPTQAQVHAAQVHKICKYEKPAYSRLLPRRDPLVFTQAHD